MWFYEGYVRIWDGRRGIRTNLIGMILWYILLFLHLYDLYSTKELMDFKGIDNFSRKGRFKQRRKFRVMGTYFTSVAYDSNYVKYIVF
jgi:hypothetical protein